MHVKCVFVGMLTAVFVCRCVVIICMLTCFWSAGELFWFSTAYWLFVRMLLTFFSYDGDVCFRMYANFLFGYMLRCISSA